MEKVENFAKTVFFPLKFDTTNSAEVKITGKPINDDNRMRPIKSYLNL